MREELYVSGGLGKRRRRRWLLIPLVPIVLFLLLALLRVGSPEGSVELDRPGLGSSTTVTATASESGRGLGSLRLEVEQEGNVTVLAKQDHEPRPFFRFWGPRTSETSLVAEAGSRTLPELTQGQATLRLVAERAGSFLRRPSPLVVERVVPVKLRPPSLSVLSSQVVVRQGGSSVVVYRVDEPASRDGVRAGEHWFRGYDLPGAAEGTRFAFFAAAHDLSDGSEVRIEVEDDYGNTNARTFLSDYRPKPPKTSTIRLSDGFMSRVVPAIVADSGLREKETLLETYLEINRNLRKQNDQRLIELATSSREQFLWRPPFRQQANSQVMDAFASERDYYYDDRIVDHQTHLGYDLASRRHDEVTASSSGVVAFAESLGIYGNAVVIDHGYGLMSLYAHLSSVDVDPGQEVAAGEVVGRSGQTGLAGGDHLHFSILVQGIPVDPVEWWDRHWIETRIDVNLGDALPW